jgi:hypothetical protein
MDTLVMVWNFCNTFDDLLGLAPLQLEQLEAMLLWLSDKNNTDNTDNSFPEKGKEGEGGGLLTKEHRKIAKSTQMFPLFDEICTAFCRVLLPDLKVVLGISDSAEWQAFSAARPLNTLTWPELARQYMLAMYKRRCRMPSGHVYRMLDTVHGGVMQACADVHNRICSFPLAKHFLQPIATIIAAHSDYQNYVTKPIDLGQVGKRLVSGYGGNYFKFAADMRLVFNNCKVLVAVPNNALLRCLHAGENTSPVLCVSLTEISFSPLALLFPFPL